MDVVLHDFSGHPFQAELSRKLAAAGNEVEHVFAAQYVSGKGHLSRQPQDGPSLSFTGIVLDLPFLKYSPLARLRFERAYGRVWIKKLKAKRPDAVIACNLPLISMYLFARFARRTKLPYVMWHQDIYSYGLRDELRRKLPRPMAAAGARVFARMEAYCVRHSSHVVAIGEEFRYVYPSWGVKPGNVSVIPNWAPLDEVYPVGRTNPSSALLFSDDVDSLRLVYAGTIGRKHNPQLLVDLLRNALDNGINVSLAVISEGEAANDLAEIARDTTLPLTVHPFQPVESLPDVLGSADVLVAVLEPDATKFSIPSKVLSYMAAGRPILGLMPSDNPAAMDIRESGGFVAEPTEPGAKSAVVWLTELSTDRNLVTSIGRRTRGIAEKKFDIDTVTSQFGTILAACVR